ncbi:MAG: hypothetical protein MJK04_20750, partial [Psychrosphaera sp.]|nr:hypothetical protein [Psychrosphaera sp.]
MFKVNSYFHLAGYFCFGIALLIAIDPGWSIWLRSLQYDLHEGENILPRLLVLLCSSVIVLFPFLGARRDWLLVYSLLLFPLCLLGYSFVLIQGQFTFWEVSIVINEWGLGADALSAFLPQVTMATAITLAVILALWVLRPRLTDALLPLSGRLLSSRKFQAALFLPWLLPTAYLLLAGGGYWINHFALPLKVPASFAFSLSHPVYVGPRNAVVLEAPATKPVNLIFIVDESVRGDFLWINNIDENTTPFFRKNPAINFTTGAIFYRMFDGGVMINHFFSSY